MMDTRTTTLLGGSMTTRSRVLHVLTCLMIVLTANRSAALTTKPWSSSVPISTMQKRRPFHPSSLAWSTRARRRVYATANGNDEKDSDEEMQDNVEATMKEEAELALSLTTPPLWQDSSTQPALSSSSSTTKQAVVSKRKMLGFAVPALGIFLCNPLLSNIDNAFVGQTVGTQGLAAMSPATLCTDQMLFLFTFLGRATTGLVSRTYKFDEETGQGDNSAAREAASSPLSVALMAGAVVTLIYALYTPRMLTALQVAPSLRAPASSYIYWRGAIAWAALAQNVILNILLATRDAITPLKIVLLAALVNVVGDYMCCVWPLQMGCGGAAAATAFATLFRSFFMVRSLKRKNLLPPLRLPTKQQLADLMEFTGPLLAITLTRLIGSINMARAASRLGVQQLAAYQMSINVMWLFMLFGEPLSQLSQTQLPALVDDTERARGPLIQATLKSILTLGACTAVTVGSIAALLMTLGTGIFSSDVAVQSLAKGTAPALFMAVAAGIFTVSVDGAMLASRDFRFMLIQGTLSLLVQSYLLASSWCSSVSSVFAIFTLRLTGYASMALIRVALGYGPLGQALRRRDNLKDGVINGGEAVNGAIAPPAAVKSQPMN